MSFMYTKIKIFQKTVSEKFNGQQMRSLIPLILKVAATDDL